MSDATQTGYAAHAAVWDWDAFDDTPEFARWCAAAERFGRKVLLPMCALGQLGDYMARQGFRVTGLDLCPEMISEGQARFGGTANFTLLLGDVCDFSLEECAFDFVLLKGQDLCLLPGLKDVHRALACIARHTRHGGGLVLPGLALPSRKSYETPWQTFQPRVPRAEGLKVWKEGRSRYDATTRQHAITQIVHVDDTQFLHEIRLQYYTRRELLRTLRACGWTKVQLTMNNEELTICSTLF